MNRRISIFLIFILLLINPVSTNAMESSDTGQFFTHIDYRVTTTDGIDSLIIQVLNDALLVQRTITHEGIVTPPTSIFTTETYNGITYSGTLQLANVRISDNKTYATYRGTLYPVN